MHFMQNMNILLEYLEINIKCKPKGVSFIWFADCYFRKKS